MSCGCRIGWVHYDYEDEMPIKVCNDCYNEPIVNTGGDEFLESK